MSAFNEASRFKKIISFMLATIISASLVGFTYRVDMNYKLKRFAKEQIKTIHYDTLRMNIDEYSIYPIVKDKLEGKTLENYIVSKCELTPALRKYFTSSNQGEDNPDYYDSVRTIKSQLTTTIYELCDFMEDVEKMYPNIIIDEEEIEKW